MDHFKQPVLRWWQPHEFRSNETYFANGLSRDGCQVGLMTFAHGVPSSYWLTASVGPGLRVWNKEGKYSEQ